MALRRDDALHTVAQCRMYPKGAGVTVEGTVDRVFPDRETQWGPEQFFTWHDPAGDNFAATVKPPPANLQPGRTFWMGQGDKGGARIDRYVSKKDNEEKVLIKCPRYCFEYTDEEGKAAPQAEGFTTAGDALPDEYTKTIDSLERTREGWPAFPRPVPSGKMTTEQLFELQASLMKRWKYEMTS